MIFGSRRAPREIPQEVYPRWAVARGEDSRPDEQMAYFELDVSKAKGFNTIEVVANGNGEASTYKVEIDVNNPNPITSNP